MSWPSHRDLLVALAAGVALQVDQWLIEPGGPRGVAAVTVIAAAVFATAFAFRRTRPLLMAGLAAGAVAGQALLGGELTTTVTMLAAAMAVAFLIGAQLPRRTSAIAAAAFLLATWIDTLVEHDPEYSVVSDLVFTSCVVVAGPWLAGRALADRRRRTQELEELTHRLEAERATEARVAMLDERSRIAREMHDVVAHSVSLMVVQAGAARQLLDEDPAQSRSALEAVEDEGRKALQELRRVLGILRGQAGAAALSPQPGTAQLDELFESTRRSGLPVEVHVDGEPRPLPAGVDLVAFRIVQEALTNTVKHAAAGRATVRIGYGARALTLEVADDGRGHNGQVAPGSHGLVGMRERVVAYGGTIETGGRSGGGFSVRVRLPLQEDA